MYLGIKNMNLLVFRAKWRLVNFTACPSAEEINVIRLFSEYMKAKSFFRMGSTVFIDLGGECRPNENESYIVSTMLKAS